MARVRVRYTSQGVGLVFGLWGGYQQDVGQGPTQSVCNNNVDGPGGDVEFNGPGPLEFSEISFRQQLGISSIGFEIWAGPATVTVEAYLGETLVKQESFALAPATQIGVGNSGVVTLTVPGTLDRFRILSAGGSSFCIDNLSFLHEGPLPGAGPLPVP